MISEFPLFVFTTLGGLAAGAYVVDAFFGGKRQIKRAWLFPLVCMVLLGVGLLGVLGHLGRPERFLFALSNPSAMIAQEAYWSIAFGLLLLVDLVIRARGGESPTPVRVLGALAAGGLLCIMANAYFTSFGNPAWAALPTLPLFVGGSLATGAAFVAALNSSLIQKGGFSAVLICLLIVSILSIGAEALHFRGLGYDVIPFVISLVLVLLGIIACVLARMEKLPAKVTLALAFGCVFAGTCVVRCAFYAASVV